MIHSSPYSSLRTLSGSRGCGIAIGIQTESSRISEGIDLSLSHDGPRLSRANQTDHLQDASIIPDVTNTRDLVLGKRGADDLEQLRQSACLVLRHG